ncbi:VOC family protein [Herpetosiphon llansteffanensis]|uniref:VOC family protein n=1 Tax=Herpetosiphon llansteffanensis TaxID=2094568 RepID=UPI000D7D0954|nr:VOC family protein [Herpetosiphon llansteffanensis]
MGYVPAGYATVNPFIITNAAQQLSQFLQTVFGAQAVEAAHTLDTDGLWLHSEFKIGDSTVMVVDRKPDWPWTPSFLQIYVADLAQTLQTAVANGATIVTEPTPIYGELFSRILDPWHNLWWVYQVLETEPTWESSAPDSESWDTESPELSYIHTTLMELMPRLGQPNVQ